ncbi:MAG TPA: hypothetical protein VNN80_03595, partial [Polyangiaceae bacterium]|nr:hypothetical protein [Polyangiaceae bacterium]
MVFRWARRVAAALAALIGLALAAAALATATAWGRARLLAATLDVAQGSIAGRLEVDALERLSPFGVTLRGVRVHDPSSGEVVGVAVLAAELAPLELLSGRIVLRSLTVGPGRVDLRDLDSPERGLLSAFRARSPSAPAPEQGSPPYVRVDELRLAGIDIVLPELAPPWRALSVRGLAATARFELDGAPELTLRALAFELWRGERALGRVSRATGQLARPGQPSELQAALELGSARLDLGARAALPGASDGSAPFDLRLRLAGLRGADLADLLEDAALSSAVQGEVALELQAGGTIDDLSARASLVSAGGAIELRGALAQRHLARLEASSEGLRLGALRAGLPEGPLAFTLEASADVADRARVPLRLGWRQARLGGVALPELAATATWDGHGVTGLDVAATRGASRLGVRGGAGVDGLFDLALSTDLGQAELRELATLVGLPNAPASALGAELRVARGAGERWRVDGWARASRLAWAGVTASSARVDVALAGPLLAPGGELELRADELVSGGYAVRGASVRLTAADGGYRLRASGRGRRVQASLDVHARRELSGVLLWGQGAARLDDLPFALELSQTRVGFDGSLLTRGLALDAGGQRLRVSGRYAASGVELAARLSGVDLATLSGPLGLVAGWRGRAELDLRVRGRLAAPRVDAALHVRDLSRAGAAPIGGTLAAILDVEQGRASLDGVIAGSDRPWLDVAFALAARLGRGARWWEGWSSAEQHAALEVRALELAELERWLGQPLPVSGRVALSGALSGSVEQPSVDATLRARLSRAFGLGALSVEQRLRYDAGSADAVTAIADARGPWLDLATRLELPREVAADLRALGPHARELADASRWSLSLAARRRTLGEVWAAAPAALGAIAAEGSLRLEHGPSSEPSGDLRLFAEQSAAGAPRTGCALSDIRAELVGALRDGVLSATVQATRAGGELLSASVTSPVLVGPALRGGGVLLGSMSGELVSRALELGSLPLLCERASG